VLNDLKLPPNLAKVVVHNGLPSGVFGWIHRACSKC
jgi:hypothetical protein